MSSIISKIFINGVSMLDWRGERVADRLVINTTLILDQLLLSIPVDRAVAGELSGEQYEVSYSVKAFPSSGILY